MTALDAPTDARTVDPSDGYSPLMDGEGAADAALAAYRAYEDAVTVRDAAYAAMGAAFVQAAQAGVPQAELARLTTLSPSTVRHAMLRADSRH